jgi:hypothetical protein
MRFFCKSLYVMKEIIQNKLFQLELIKVKRHFDDI